MGIAGTGTASAAAAAVAAAAGGAGAVPEMCPRTGAEQQVTSKQQPITQQRSRPWNATGSLGEVDSLQNAIDAFKVPTPSLLHTSLMCP